MIKSLKEWLKLKLRKALALDDLTEQIYRDLAHCRAEIEQLRREKELFGVGYWYEENLWEPTVQLALRDLCRPGDVVFDAGAAFGGLTISLSRWVGSKGTVCAFEASPRNAQKCQRNLVFNGCNNVQLYLAAVYRHSQGKMPIYLGNHLDDRIYPTGDNDKAAFQVSTLALDDFIRETGLVPNVVKMDIEGAEFDGVTGMLETIATAKPHLILESDPQDLRCLDLLRDKGYIAIDVSTYSEVNSAADYPEGAIACNTLYIHRDRLSEVPYQFPLTFVDTAVLTAENFHPQEDGSLILSDRLHLDRGRYLIDVNFRGDGEENEMMCGIKTPEKVIFRYHSNAKLLSRSYRHWMIHLDEESDISLYFEFIGPSRDPSFSAIGAKIQRIAEFDSLPRPILR